MTRTPVVVMIVLGVLLAVGAIALGKKEKKETVEKVEAYRAVIVPTVDRTRTVVVAPCDAPPDQTLRNAQAGQATPGATLVELPRGDRTRTVLVPHCLEGVGTAAGRAPSVAYVAPPDTERHVNQIAQSRLTLPGGSEIDTIVVPRCPGGTTRQRDAVLGPLPDDDTVSLAPAC